MLGFGFNKERTRAAAEKYVQSNKLPQAIGEYEKLLKHDPKDLAILNTVGDLYIRINQPTQAVQNFRTVAESYAKDGHAVKAIAIYKKLTKVNPKSLEDIEKLAELYAQQKLVGEARQQFAVLADGYSRGGRPAEAVRILRRALTFDPENVALLARLADLLTQSGSKKEAHEVLMKAAGMLYERRSLEAGRDVLGRVLKIEPSDTRAQEMLAKISLELGDFTASVAQYEAIPDYESRPSALRGILRAYLQLGRLEDADKTARTLQSKHTDASGLLQIAERYFNDGQTMNGLRVLDEFTEPLLSNYAHAMASHLHAAVGKVKGEKQGLDILQKLFQRMGDLSQMGELLELRAQVATNSGELEVARDLYYELTLQEPDNPVHLQSYRQLCAKLGGPSPNDAGTGKSDDMQDIPAPAPVPILQKYSPEVEELVRSALSEAELCESYSAPANALPSLEAVLEHAPDDIRLNRTLAGIYTRIEKPELAHRCYARLYRVYVEHGHVSEAKTYATLAGFEMDEGGTITAKSDPTTPEGRPMFPDYIIEQVAAPPPTPKPVAYGEVEEIDLSDEWQEVYEHDVRASAPAAPAAAPATESVSELIEEIRFYFAQAMWRDAQIGIERLAKAAPSHPALARMRQQLAEAGVVSPPSSPVPPRLKNMELVVEEEEETFAPPPNPEPPLTFAAAAETFEPIPSPPVIAAPHVEPPAPQFEPPAPVTPPEPVRAYAAPSWEAPVAPPPAPAEPTVVAATSAPREAAAPARDSFESFTSDLDASLGAEFDLGAPASAPASAPPQFAHTPVPVAPTPIAASTPVQAAPSFSPPAPKSPPDEENAMFSDLLAEFKDDLEAPGQNEDLEQHYSLGIAFREMGLLDEAIGELQKVCSLHESGGAFPQILQAYTWLATCFVEKELPEASLRWYERALAIAPDEQSRSAIHYDLGVALEAAGEKPQALQHFLHVLGTNIDYRDTSDRVRELRAELSR